MPSGVVEQVAELVKAVLTPEPEVEAVFLSGSYAAGAEAPDSDIDFTVLTEHHADGYTHGVPEYVYSGKRLCVSIVPRPDAEAWIDHVFFSWEELLDYQGFLQHKFIDAVPVLDPLSLLADHQRRLSDDPDDVTRDVVVHALQHLKEEYLDDWHFRSVFHFAYCLGDVLERVGQAIYACNKRIYSPPLKRLHRDLPTLEPDISADLARLASISPADDLETQRIALATIVNKLWKATP